MRKRKNEKIVYEDNNKNNEDNCENYTISVDNRYENVYYRNALAIAGIVPAGAARKYRC